MLIENNKYGIVRHFESRGYDGYVMDRPDHLRSNSSSTNVKTKGIPSNSQDVIQAHASAIEDYIHKYVGLNELGEPGKMYFNRTLEDWIGFKIDKRTKYDLSISSGLAIMACNRHLYRPNAIIEKPKLNINIAKYTNTGNMSKLSHHNTPKINNTLAICLKYPIIANL